MGGRSWQGSGGETLSTELGAPLTGRDGGAVGQEWSFVILHGFPHVLDGPARTSVIKHRRDGTSQPQQTPTLSWLFKF
jgi:hypothetical protein